MDEKSKIDSISSISSKSSLPLKTPKSNLGKTIFKTDELGEDITVVIPELKYKQMLILYDKFIKNREYHKMYHRNKVAKRSEVRLNEIVN